MQDEIHMGENQLNQGKRNQRRLWLKMRHERYFL